MRKTKILIFLLFCFQSSFAHSDFWQTRQYGNVITRVISGFDFEEIHKVKLIGQMTRDLCDSLNYKDTIYLDFKHAYTSPIKSTYFVGVDNNWLDYYNGELFYFSQPNIIITEHGQTFDFKKTLKLVEYAITNKKKVLKEQKRRETQIRYSYFDLNTISTKKTLEIAKGKSSTLVENILLNKYYRELDIERPYLSCYWSRGEYHFEARRYNKPDTLIFSTKNIYSSQFFQEAAFIYTTDSNLVFINGLNPFASKEHLIEEKSKIFEYRPIKFVQINRYNYACSFSFHNPDAKTMEEALQLHQRTLFYQVANDKLIQNLEAEIK